jgi:hypothetical protein
MWDTIAVNSWMNHRISYLYERIRNQITLDVVICLAEYCGFNNNNNNVTF